MLFVDVAEATRAVAATSKRSEKIAVLADLLRGASPDEVASVVTFATGAASQGRIGVGWATIRDVRPEPAPQPTLTVLDVDRTIDELAVDRRRRVGRPSTRQPPRPARSRHRAPSSS